MWIQGRLGSWTKLNPNPTLGYWLTAQLQDATTDARILLNNAFLLPYLNHTSVESFLALKQTPNGKKIMYDLALGLNRVLETMQGWFELEIEQDDLPKLVAFHP